MKNGSMLIFVFITILYVKTAAGSECETWVTRHPEWIWCDDFESNGELEDRYEDVSLNGLSQSEESSFDGVISLRQSYEVGQVSAGWVIKVADQGFPDHIFVRWYHKFGPGYVSVPPKMARVGYRQRFGSWDTIFRVNAWSISASGELTADVVAQNSSQTESGWLPLRRSGYSSLEHLGEWVAIEIELNLNSPGEADGYYRFWVNDELVIEVQDVDLRGNTTDRTNEVMLDGYWNGGSTGSLVRYFDNFVISSQKIGLYTSSSTDARPLPPSSLITD